MIIPSLRAKRGNLQLSWVSHFEIAAFFNNLLIGPEIVAGERRYD